MTLLDISQSKYIFQQNIIVGFITVSLAICISIFLGIHFTKKIKPNQLKLKDIGKTVLLILTVWIIYFSFFFTSFLDTINLKKNGKETIGKTKEWIYSDGYRLVKYTFEVDGVNYTEQSGITYYGEEIKDIECPNGNYIVIYEFGNPENSAIDFKRKAK